jgi:hypothetical protein
VAGGTAHPTAPMEMRMGAVSASRTSASTLRGIVAENSSVCRSGRTCPSIDLTCPATTDKPA